MEMFDDFFEGKVDLYKLNFGFIIIIPKEKYFRTMNKFRPISLLNCSYKIFTWVSTSRMGLVADLPKEKYVRTMNKFRPINIENEEEETKWAKIFGSPMGILLHYSKLSIDNLQPLVDKIIKMIDGWRGKLLTRFGRIVLIKTCLASISVYLLSFLKFPKWSIDLINSHMINCF
jgi:hypothetical protein